MQDQNQYFANLPAPDVINALYDKVVAFYEQVDRNGRLRLWRKAHRYFFALDSGGNHEASAIASGGEQGELSLLKANHYRNLLQHLHVLTTQNRPTFECRAVNTDHASQVQTILGRNILDYYMRERRLDTDFRYAAEVAINYSEAYIELEWDPGIGDPVRPEIDPETGEPTDKIINSGDTQMRVYEPINVIRAIYSDKARQDWYILRRHISRFELMARYPTQAEAIRTHSDDTQTKYGYYDNSAFFGDEESQDLLPVYVFYHDRTAACSNGRRTVFLGNSIMLEDAPLDSADMPVYPMIPARQHGTSFGYSVSFDLMCVQEAIDLIYSTILSNQAAFGVQNIWMKPGTQLSPTQLSGGLNLFESMEKPESINLTNTPPEIFKFMQGLEQLGEVLSGVNSVARGQPEASLKSGSALALVASQAVQFSNGLQAAFTRLLEDTGTGLLRMLQNKANLPRAAAIAGSSNRSFVKDFVGSDIANINRVIVDVGNPVSRTIAGRLQMAQDLLQAQVIKHPEQYIQVVETGSLDPLIDDQRAEELLINSENEALREGRPVTVLAVDNHLQHIQEHKTVLADPESRLQAALAKSVLDHIQAHISALRTTDPGLLNALGQQALAAAPGGAPPPQSMQGKNAPQPNTPEAPTGQPPQPGQQIPAPPNTPPNIAQQLPKLPTAPEASGQ